MTRKSIESKLPEGYGIDKCEGVWYFNGGDTIEWPDTCAHVCTLDVYTINEWLSMFNYLKNRYEERIS